MYDFYISGPMTGLPSFNFPAFFACERALIDKGYFVGNPANGDPNWQLPERPTWSDYMRQAYYMLVNSKAVAVLPGWENSHGARAEVFTALELGIPVYLYTKPEDVGKYLAWQPVPPALLFAIMRVLMDRHLEGIQERITKEGTQ